MVTSVKECTACGAICSSMDTLCPRCQQYGTLREGFQCGRCQRFLENQTCWVCGPEVKTEQITLKQPPPGTVPGDLREPRLRADLVDPHAVHPALASGLGGGVVGGTAGALGGLFLFGENPLLLGLIGLVLGAILGALLGGNVPGGRHGR